MRNFFFLRNICTLHFFIERQRVSVCLDVETTFKKEHWTLCDCNTIKFISRNHCLGLTYIRQQPMLHIHLFSF